MCGIIGYSDLSLPQTVFKTMQHRGSDAANTISNPLFAFHHDLHAVNGHVEQPFTTETSVFLTNCEVYNADELNEDGRNDAEQLHLYLDQEGITTESLEAVDGVYALAHYDQENKELKLARDIIGVKPVWYYHGDDGFAFASEKKALLKANLPVNGIRELHPRQILTYDADTNEVTTTQRDFSLITSEEQQVSLREAAEQTAQLIDQAIKKRIPEEDVAVLFSGGIDSALLTHCLQRNGAEPDLYYAGVPGSDSRSRAEAVAQKLGLPLNVADIEVSKRVKPVTDIIDDAHYVKLSVALAFDAATEQASRDGHKVIMSGTGVEEIHGGYHRLQTTSDVNDECRSGLRSKYYEDLYRDDTVTMHHGLELRVPFLDHDLVEHAMSIPHDVKQVTTKQVIREAAKKLGLPDDMAEQPKSATQYGSGTANHLKALAAEHDEHVGDYIDDQSNKPNTRLAVLLSTGKDSCLATQRMIDYNYDISCFATVKPDEQNSWMSHDANTSIAELQARAAQKPLLIESSSGAKDVELKDYKAVLRRARDDHGVEGVVTGAVQSEYQRQRIERICESLGLKAYTPLWHTPGDSVLKQLLKRGFDVVFEKTAAAGLDDSWVGSRIKPHTIEELRDANEAYGVHIAGEGGEFETVVLDAPFFQERIVLDDAETRSEGHVHRLHVRNAHLEARDE